MGAALGLAARDGAHGIAEVVVENMANAARVHAVERGKTLGDRTLIAFGGAAPVHAARAGREAGDRAHPDTRLGGRGLGGRLPARARRL